MKIDPKILDEMTWSFSRIHSWDTGCKYGWWLTYVLPQILKQTLPDDVYHFVRGNLKKEGNFFSDYGSYIHGLLDKYGKEQLDIFSILDECKKHYDENIKHEAPPNKFCDLADTYRSQAEAYFSNFDGFNQYKILFTEKEVKFKTKYNRDFIGYIDIGLEDVETGKITLGDHKSKKKFTSKKEQKEYARQLYIYSKPFKEIYGKYPDYLAFNLFRVQDKVIIPFKKTDFTEAENWIENTIQDIYNATEFPMIANDNDFMCSQLCNWRFCCNWKQVLEHKEEMESSEDKDEGD